MPPRTFTNPAPKTDSARAAAQSFFCSLCQKGYTRQPDYAAHLGSYDHQHKQRLKDLKAMSRPQPSTSARERSKKLDEQSGLITIKPLKLGGSGEGKTGGFKKGGFKRAFGGDDDDDDAKKVGKVEEKTNSASPVVQAIDEKESEDEDEGYECYDPSRPTDCYPGCPGS
ncbi:MAG: hypothetical protein M1834_001236 [Cirrosporium novae-zelandiae]|nr:MAG: hypothetical protein M1834_001236 [Cirrosporium novae-zelandiae]